MIDIGLDEFDAAPVEIASASSSDRSRHRRSLCRAARAALHHLHDEQMIDAGRNHRFEWRARKFGTRNARRRAGITPPGRGRAQEAGDGAVQLGSSRKKASWPLSDSISTSDIARERVERPHDFTAVPRRIDQSLVKERRKTAFSALEGIASVRHGQRNVEIVDGSRNIEIELASNRSTKVDP